MDDEVEDSLRDKAQFRWLNPPAHAEHRDDGVFVRTGAETDFWRETYYGFWHDNGHFFHRTVQGDFTAEVTVDGRYETLYDQAGLMVRLGEANWVKAGIEYTDGAAYFSVVVTNNQSDWSLLKIPPAPSGQRLRLTRHSEAIRVQYLDSEAGKWKMARLAYLPRSSSIEVGIMCCSPQRAGFEAAFRDFTLESAISHELHV
jgi:regulation of enolase protein 1 (concanavalin A-like superfamily)